MCGYEGDSMRGIAWQKQKENLYEVSSLAWAISRVSLAKEFNLEQSCAENSSQPIHAVGRL
jgi:hypothetical protein